MHFGMRFGVPFIVLAAMLGSCSNGPTEGNPNGEPRVTVRLTDAAGDIKAAVVTITEVNLQGSNGKVVLSNEAVTTDLTHLANTTAILVDAEPVPAGTYTEMRFVISGAYIEVENADGSTSIYASSPTYAGLPAGAFVTHNLQMPSLGQSGLKVSFAATELAITEDQGLLVDFDVSQSFGHEAGNSGQWVMHPVVKGGQFTTAATVVVTLKMNTGVVLPIPQSGLATLAAFKANLSGEMVTFSDPDGDGTFEARFRFLLPGTYSLSVQPPTGIGITTNVSLPVSVTLGTGQTSTQAVIIQTAFLAP